MVYITFTASWKSKCCLLPEYSLIQERLLAVNLSTYQQTFISLNSMIVTLEKGENMFKVNNEDTRIDVINVVLESLLLTHNILHTFF